MSATLKDIAEYLGLSTSSVSRVLNNKGRISEETRKKVFEAAEKFHYRPNETARELKMQRSSTVGVIIPDVANTFYVKMLKSMDQMLWDAGYSIIFCDTNENIEREKAYFELLKSKKVSGMIIATTCKSDIYEKESKLGNYVFVDNAPYITNKPYSFVSVDNERASYELTQKIIEYGHRDIAMISGNLDESSSNDRVAGFKNCLSDYGIPFNPRRHYIGDCHYNSGYEITKKLIEHDNLPTIIYAHNNVEGFGAMYALKEENIRIPEDVSLVCFDGQDDAKLIEPVFTGVSQPIERIGETAVQMIIDNLKNDGNHFKTVTNFLDYTFIEGRSLKKVN